jgi:hypothetical protein
MSCASLSTSRAFLVFRDRPVFWDAPFMKSFCNKAFQGLTRLARCAQGLSFRSSFCSLGGGRLQQSDHFNPDSIC